MKNFLTGIVCLQFFSAQALECDICLENDRVCVAVVKIMPYELIGLHRDEYSQVVIASKGGIITRLEADGTTTDVEFPTGIAVFREADPPEELHQSINNSSETIELMIIHLKT